MFGQKKDKKERTPYQNAQEEVKKLTADLDAAVKKQNNTQATIDKTIVILNQLKQNVQTISRKLDDAKARLAIMEQQQQTGIAQAK